MVGRLSGGEPGPTIVLNGHLDTVPIPHEPPRVEDGTIYGRGTADMKGALACAAEAARAVAGAGSFPGELVIVAIGLHESPVGRGEDLDVPARRVRLHGRRRRRLRARRPTLPVAHPGCATFEIAIRRDGTVTHELKTPAGTPNPILVAARVIEAIRARNEELAAVDTSGSARRRTSSARCTAATSTTATRSSAASSARAAGRRETPSRRRRPEFRALLEPIAAESGCAIELDLRLLRGAYGIDPEDRLVVALREATAT